MLRDLPLSPKEEVLMSSSCSIQGLLIAENAVWLRHLVP